MDKIFNDKIIINLNRVLREDESIMEKELLELFINLQRKKFRNYLRVNSNVLLNIVSIFSGKQLEAERCSIAITKVIDFLSKKVYACPQSVSTHIGSFNENGIIINDQKVKEYAKICAKKINVECFDCDMKYICSEGCVLETKQNNCKESTLNTLKIILENFEIFFN